MQRVIVIGCPGAGKSTFARRLRDKTGLPLVYLDRLWHLPDRTTVTREEFDRRLAEVMARPQWILDGNYDRTLETRMRACDTVVLLDYPIEVCLAGAASRIGTQREEMPWVEQEFDPAFRQWILDFPTTQLPHIYDLLARYGEGKTVYVFHNRQETEAFWQGWD